MTAWLTQIIVDERRADVRRDLADAARLHQRTMMLVPDGIGDDARALAGLLFRAERGKGTTRLLVQSRLEPVTDTLPTGYGRSEIRTLDGFLKGLAVGMPVHYRLTANTAKRGGRNAGENEGKIIPLRGAAADEWWVRRAPACGLDLRTVTGFPLDDATGFRGRGRQVRHALTRFDGVAVISDAEALRDAVLDGVGRAKSYGAGLLSLAPMRAMP